MEEIERMRPLVGAFSSATITDPRPIPVPAFRDTTPSALVGDHVEGVPDVAGVVNFDQITVTPKAKSGRAEITRELLDSSPVLADRVVSGALRESYAQMTESTMAGVLAAGATVGPAGGATAITVEQAIRSRARALARDAVRPGARHPAELRTYGRPWSAPMGPTGAPCSRTCSTGRQTRPARPRRRTHPARSPAWKLARRGPWRRPTSSSGRARPTRCPLSRPCFEFRFAEKSGPELIEFNVWGYFGAVVLQKLGVILITSTVAAGDSGDMRLAGDDDERTGRGGRPSTKEKG